MISQIARPLGLGLLLLATSATMAGQPLAEITLEPDFPVRAQPSTVSISDAAGPIAGAELEVFYRPNSETASSEHVGRTDAEGILTWRPRRSGPVRLVASEGDHVLAVTTASVRAGSFAPSGLVIFTAAFVLLFGGAGAGLAHLLRERTTPHEHLPSS